MEKMAAGGCTLLMCALLLSCTRQTLAGRSAGGYFPFISSYNYYTVPRGDDTYGEIYYENGDFTTFQFGCNCAGKIYVSTNGYFSLNGEPPYDNLPHFPLANDDWIVAPFAADIDTSDTGYVRYAGTDGFTDEVYDSVANFVREQTGNTQFRASGMIFAEWNGVPLYNGDLYRTNTFQGIIVTSQELTYAVFIYECGGMDWDRGVIGWQSNASNYKSHPLSGQADNNDIGCLYSDEYSAVVYLLSDCIPQAGYFTCSNRECVLNSKVCDGSDDCGDNSDEGQDCSPFPTAYVIAGGVGAVWVAVSIAAIVYLVYGWKRVKTPNSRRAPLTANTVPHTSAPLLGSDNTEHQQASDTPYREYKERNIRSNIPQLLVNPVSGATPSPSVNQP